jgi:hypothetical protein
MQPIRRRQAEAVEVTYRFDWRGREQRIRVRSDHSPDAPPSASPARMIMAPRWRFSAANQDSVRRTRIERPAPSVCRVQEHHVTVDGPSVYGELGRLIEDRSPAHVLLSPDATVTLRWPERG